MQLILKADHKQNHTTARNTLCMRNEGRVYNGYTKWGWYLSHFYGESRLGMHVSTSYTEYRKPINFALNCCLIFI